MKREDTNYSYKNETGTINTDPAKIKRIIREYYEQLCIHTFDMLYEMGQSLEKHKLP